VLILAIGELVIWWVGEFALHALPRVL